ncbi:MAG: acyl-CoA synthetase [Acidimicrobiales bacterium]
MEFNLADLFESAADAFGEREYLVAENKRRTYAEMEQRANRLAHHLAESGVKAGDHVGIYAYNSVEWVETLWATFKIRATWININYRYVQDELAYLFSNADLVALVHQREFTPRVRAVRDKLALLAHTVVIDDDSEADLDHYEHTGYEEAMASGHPERDFGPRSPDDRYILFTGGTTGMPKGVVWRHEDVFFALGGGIDALTLDRVTRPEDMVAKGLAAGYQLTTFPIAPLMHGASQWAVMGASFIGNRVLLLAKFDAATVWSIIETEKVNAMMITGDAMARPLIEELGRPDRHYDTSSFFSLNSSAAIFSPSVKDEFFARFPNLIMTDAVGSSETGNNGLAMVSAGHTAMKGGPTVVAGADTVVLDDEYRPMKPGTGVMGRLARTGNIPLCYYKDPAKSAETFVSAHGARYSLPGDFALLEADGTITLVGRGSASINSGGEKIFPEEVEAAVKSHPDVYDSVVVGIPDDRWGQKVVVVVEPRPGCTVDLESVQAHCRTRIASYKIPRQITVVSAMQRSPSGKADYPWAKSMAMRGATNSQPDDPTPHPRDPNQPLTTGGSHAHPHL